MDKKFLEFPVVIYGNLEKVNDVLSKARCRIFYKGGNRNGTYITDEFAEKFISTLPYVPIKGIFESESGDFSDHGTARNEGQIYGIVPESNNFQWESHLDEDGVSREYACTDVYLFSALFPEASSIIGKSQSMEIYEPSITYHFEVLEGQKYLVFDEGSFLGLQVLGDEYEPCFEGASFYTLRDSIQSLISQIKSYSLNSENKGGQPQMSHINFKLSDSEKHDALWSLINTEYNEENGWMVTHSIMAIYDDYAIAFSYATGDYERIYYTKDDSTDSVAINKRKKCFIIDVTESEKATLDTLRQLNGDTYELVAPELEEAAANFEKIQELDTKIGEYTEQISTLTSERDNSHAEYEAAQEQISTLTEELEALRQYRLDVETAEKEAVISEYENQLSDEVLDAYRAKMDSYTALDLDKDLTYELKKAGSAVFTKKPSEGIIPKDNSVGGIEEILLKYKK